MSEYPSYLIHYGIQGQKWGVKRFQNDDGTYTTEGLQRRRQALQNGASKEELKRMDEVAKRELVYNKNLIKRQKSINRKFDKVTEKIKSDKEAGKQIKDGKIKKAIKLGTEFRKIDYIAKDPSFYYNKRDEVVEFAKKAGHIGLLGLPLVAIKDASANNKINKHYEKVFEQAKNETVKDLKKHKIIANNQRMSGQDFDGIYKNNSGSKNTTNNQRMSGQDFDGIYKYKNNDGSEIITNNKKIIKTINEGNDKKIKKEINKAKKKPNFAKEQHF